MENKDDAYFMGMAMEQARIADAAGEVPIGAVVVCGGEIISEGHNMTEQLDDPTAHAEMIAMTAACNAIGGKYLSDCTLYVTVEPCPMCAAAMNWAQLGRVVYGAPDVKRGYSIFSPPLLHPRTKVDSGILSDECSAIVKEFFARKR